MGVEMDKVIDLNQWRQKKEIADKSTPIPGVIVWLHCPNCQSTEYSELQVPGGRIHKCGTLVEEVEVAIDVRAEYTISQRNLAILEKLSEKISGIKNKLIRKWIRDAQILELIKENEREFQHRLEMITKEKMTPYSDVWDPLENGIEIVKEQPTGILITNARQADKHFPRVKKK